MALPLIIKAAALGGAAYVASRWLSTQNRQRRAHENASDRIDLDSRDDAQPSTASIARENHPAPGTASPFPSAGPTS